MFKQGCYAFKATDFSGDFQEPDRPDHCQPEAASVAAGATVVQNEPLCTDAQRKEYGVTLTRAEPPWQRHRWRSGLGDKQQLVRYRLPDVVSSGRIRTLFGGLCQHGARDQRVSEQIRQQVEASERE